MANSECGKVVWMTGLSGSGKTTLCRAATAFLRCRGHQVQTLDGDELRKSISADLGFSIADRMENIRRAAELARMLSANATAVFVAMICPTDDMRSLVRGVLPEVIEVFVDAPLAVCETRDPKGLYKRARSGAIKDFTGISSPFDIPRQPHLVCRTDTETVQESTAKILAFLLDPGTAAESSQRRKTIAVDFDGVIADYNGWQGEDVLGAPRPDVIEALHKLRAFGWKIIIHTTRSSHAIASFLNQAAIPFDEINSNLDYRNFGPKPVATVYWDDRSLRYSGNAEQDLHQILNFRTWSGRC
jgi:adenylylsulfate kinase